RPPMMSYVYNITNAFKLLGGISGDLLASRQSRWQEWTDLFRVSMGVRPSIGFSAHASARKGRGRTLPNLFFRIVLFRRRQPRWRLGLTALKACQPPQGALGRRAIHAESPFFLILPSRRATKKVADHSSSAPGVVCFRLAFSLMFPDWS